MLLYKQVTTLYGYCMSGYVQIFAFLFNFNHAQTTCLSFSCHSEDVYYHLGGFDKAAIELGSVVRYPCWNKTGYPNLNVTTYLDTDSCAVMDFLGY